MSGHTKEYQPVPVAAAAEIAARYEKSAVIILAWDPEHGLTHTTTYGVTPEAKIAAAKGGEIAAKALGCDLARSQMYEDFRLLDVATLKAENDRLKRAFEPGGSYARLGVQRIAAERQRQITVEGYTQDHDAEEHNDGSLLEAASCYLEWVTQADPVRTYGPMPGWWPWEPEFWKPRDAIRNLEKAGALIAAEIDRLAALAAADTAGQ